MLLRFCIVFLLVFWLLHLGHVLVLVVLGKFVLDLAPARLANQAPVDFSEPGAVCISECQRQAKIDKNVKKCKYDQDEEPLLDKLDGALNVFEYLVQVRIAASDCQYEC